MNHVKLLDCTLRDGAYLVDKEFGDLVISGIISGLVDASLDYIEVGFFQNEGFGEGKTVFLNSEDAKRFIPKDKKNSMFTVLADYSRYSVENLDECTEDGIDAVRECFFKSERYDAIEACKVIKEKGYKVFVQPVDILGYTDMEILEFIEKLNVLEPYCLSIVDTFGSMYQEDLHRVFELINNNLISSCKIGFHSHNNMQLSNALSQEFIRMSAGRREVVVDGTISGMGRGAGNTPIELVAQYMVSKYNAPYDIDAILDIIDNYMDSIRARCDWGYSTPYFIAGAYSAHVNNIAYLTEKNSIRSKDIRYILNKIGGIPRKRYDYDLLENVYIDYMKSDIEDEKALESLSKILESRNVLVLVPGQTVKTEDEKIQRFIKDKNPIVISVNFIHDLIQSDYVYMSNTKRYRYWSSDNRFKNVKKIITSNIKINDSINADYIISFVRLIKCGWEHVDNSTLMLLRLLDLVGVSKIYLAGFDGYSPIEGSGKNYYSKDLEIASVKQNSIELNDEIEKMLIDFNNTRINKDSEIIFLTESRFKGVFE